MITGATSGNWLARRNIAVTLKVPASMPMWLLADTRCLTHMRNTAQCKDE